MSGRRAVVGTKLRPSPSRCAGYDFRTAKNAHPALLVALLDRCRKAGHAVTADEPLPGYDRAYVADPFGNRIELLEPVDER